MTQKEFDCLPICHCSKELPRLAQIEDISISTHNNQPEELPRDSEQLEEATVASPALHLPIIFQGKDFLDVQRC